jgi:hypothetical protein
MLYLVSVRVFAHTSFEKLTGFVVFKPGALFHGVGVNPAG